MHGLLIAFLRFVVCFAQAAFRVLHLCWCLCLCLRATDVNGWSTARYCHCLALLCPVVAFGGLHAFGGCAVGVDVFVFVLLSFFFFFGLFAFCFCFGFVAPALALMFRFGNLSFFLGLPDSFYLVPYSKSCSFPSILVHLVFLSRYRYRCPWVGTACRLGSWQRQCGNVVYGCTGRSTFRSISGYREPSVSVAPCHYRVR